MAYTDRAALVSLYSATDEATWKQQTNWNTNADLSLWSGIDVNDQHRVVKLVLRSNNLQGIVWFIPVWRAGVLYLIRRQSTSTPYVRCCCTESSETPWFLQACSWNTRHL